MSGIRDEVRFALQVSRPGLWLTSLWFYCLPVAGTDALKFPRFWLGVVFVTFPMGYMIYGWNDAVDYETDRSNPRKGSFLFGARGSKEQLARLPWRIVAVELPFLILFLWLVGLQAIWLAAAGVAVSGVYNVGFKGWPPFEVLNQFAYVLVLIFSSWLNSAPLLPWQTFVFGGAFAMHAHLFGEILDIEPDRGAGRRTTAVLLGPVTTKWLVAAMLAAEAAFAWRYFGDAVVTAFLAGSAVWFGLDAMVLWKARPYSLREMSAFMYLWNVVALVLLGWVWKTQSLLHVR